MKRRPPVPPLGDAAIDRIERGVFAALDALPVQPAQPARALRRLPAMLGILTLAGAAVTAAVIAGRGWRRSDATPAPAQISTTSSGSHLALAGAVLDVAPQSALSFGVAQDGATIVVLDRGAVACEVAPRSNRAPFVVEAGATRVTVVGTKFSVRREGEHAMVSVDHGVVEVADTNFTELVHAGERYRPGERVTRQEAAAISAPATPTSGLAERAVPAGNPGLPVSAGQIPATAERPAAPRRIHVKQTLARGTFEDERSVASSEARPRAPSVADETQSTAPAGKTGPAAAAAPPASSQEVASAEGPQRRSVRVLFELAAQLEVRDPEAALRIYGELADGNDGWAASALFAGARLEAERGQPARARAACEAYLQRFPAGPNADDARALLATLR